MSKSQSSKTSHAVRFPRYNEDINTRKRTLFHVLVDNEEWAVGDDLRLGIANSNFLCIQVGVLTDVRQVHLLADLDADLAKLGNVDRDMYLASWDQTHPDRLASSDPLVWRVEFRYVRELSQDPPEWSLAS